MLRGAHIVPARRDPLFGHPFLRPRPLSLPPTSAASEHLLKPFHRIFTLGRWLDPALLIIRRRPVVLGRRRIPKVGLGLSRRIKFVHGWRGVRTGSAAREMRGGRAGLDWGARVRVTGSLVARRRRVIVVARGDDGRNLELVILGVFFRIARLPSASRLLSGRGKGALILSLFDRSGSWSKRATLLWLLLRTRRFRLVARR